MNSHPAFGNGLRCFSSLRCPGMHVGPFTNACLGPPPANLLALHPISRPLRTLACACQHLTIKVGTLALWGHARAVDIHLWWDGRPTVGESQSAAYPSELCRYLAEFIFSATAYANEAAEPCAHGGSEGSLPDFPHLPHQDCQDCDNGPSFAPVHCFPPVPPAVVPDADCSIHLGSEL